MKSASELYVGIDPGLSGALAVIDGSNGVVSLQDAPCVSIKTGKGKRRVYVESQMVTLLENVQCAGAIQLVTIENIHAMPGQGVTSMFSMGFGLGLWLGIIAALRLPVRRIEPVAWKRLVGIARSGDDKKRAALRALQLFPKAEIGHQYRGRMIYMDGRADALLIALAGSREFRSPSPPHS